MLLPPINVDTNYKLLALMEWNDFFCFLSTVHTKIKKKFSWCDDGILFFVLFFFKYIFFLPIFLYSVSLCTEVVALWVKGEELKIKNLS